MHYRLLHYPWNANARRNGVKSGLSIFAFVHRNSAREKGVKSISRALPGRRQGCQDCLVLRLQVDPHKCPIAAHTRLYDPANATKPFCRGLTGAGVEGVVYGVA